MYEGLDYETPMFKNRGLTSEEKIAQHKRAITLLREAERAQRRKDAALVAEYGPRVKEPD